MLRYRGKLSAELDLRSPGDVDILRGLVRQADVFSQGYRPGTLASRSLSPEELAAIRPGLVYVSLCAFGHTGPWASRRGFDTVVMANERSASHGSLRWQGIDVNHQYSKGLHAERLLRESVPQYPDARLALAQVLVNRGAGLEAVAELNAYLKSAGANPDKKQAVQNWMNRITQAQGQTTDKNSKPTS